MTWWGGETDTIWLSPTPFGHIAFDACYWTPWGTLITAEESWETAPGRSHLALRPPVRTEEPDPRARHLRGTPPSNVNADFVHRNVIPRTSHEGIQFDSDGNMYSSMS